MMGLEKMMSSLRIALLAASALLIPASLAAQETQPPPAAAGATQPDEDDVIELRVGEGVFTQVSIAVPAMPTPASASTPAGETSALGRQVASIVAADLRNSGLFTATGPDGLPSVSYPQVTSPAFATWAGTGAQTLIQGFVQANADIAEKIGFVSEIRAQLCPETGSLPPRGKQAEDRTEAQMILF